MKGKNAKARQQCFLLLSKVVRYGNEVRWIGDTVTALVTVDWKIL